jgi:nucleotide-binding universal stress UspA family protein
VRIVRQAAIDTIPINNHVLIALDQSKHSQQALEHVLTSKWPEGTRFKVITVVNEQAKHIFLDPVHLSALSIHHAELVANAEILLGQHVARLNRDFGPGTASFAVLEGEVRLGILEEAEKWRAGLIVMGSRGRKMVAGLFLGTVSEAVASHARCSVEITRVRADEAYRVNQLTTSIL